VPPNRLRPLVPCSGCGCSVRQDNLAKHRLKKCPGSVTTRRVQRQPAKNHGAGKAVPPIATSTKPKSSNTTATTLPHRAAEDGFSIPRRTMTKKHWSRSPTIGKSGAWTVRVIFGRSATTGSSAPIPCTMIAMMNQSLELSRTQTRQPPSRNLPGKKSAALRGSFWRRPLRSWRSESIGSEAEGSVKESRAVYPTASKSEVSLRADSDRSEFWNEME
jgi:hypothetical protein